MVMENDIETIVQQIIDLLGELEKQKHKVQHRHKETIIRAAEWLREWQALEFAGFPSDQKHH